MLRAPRLNEQACPPPLGTAHCESGVEAALEPFERIDAVSKRRSERPEERSVRDTEPAVPKASL